MFKKILLPVDTPDYDEKTLKAVKEMAIKFDSEIVLFNTQDVSPNIYWVNDPVLMNRSPVNNEDYAKEIVKKVAEYFDDTGITVTTRTMLGDPASEIIHLAEQDTSIDLIVMSTHGMKMPRRFLLGSVTNKVVHHAKIPVLVMR